MSHNYFMYYIYFIYVLYYFIARFKVPDDEKIYIFDNNNVKVTRGAFYHLGCGYCDII